MAITDKIIERTKSFEGFREKPYKDTVGKWTIGFGRNLEDNPLSIDEVILLFQRTAFKDTKAAEDWFEMLLRHDLESHSKELKKSLAMFPMCDQDEKTVLIDMAFNMGVPNLLTFRNMLHAIDNEDKVTAAVELLDSKYAETVKTRAVANAKIIARGRYHEAVDGLKAKNPSRYKSLERFI